MVKTNSPAVIVVAVALTVLLLVGGCQSMKSLTDKMGITTSSASTKPTAKKAAAAADAQKTGDPDADEEKPPEKPLYVRIGGEKTIVALVDDLVARAAADPKVNVTRNGAPRPWQATPESVARLKTRLVQFLGTASGGPQKYEGEDMTTAHKGMRITTREFDAFADHFRAAMSTAGIAEKEQQELLAIVESTRGPIVESPAPATSLGR